MCFFITTLLLGPRAAIVIWWLLAPGRWDAAFDSVVWPLLGFVFLPWTTLTWVIVWSFNDSVSGFQWLFLAFGLLADIGSYSSGLARRRY